ncbi:hypothetical protein CTAYLR_004908 [Chrysophaeum taylorii]|uniref:Cyclic nucleotide-binding domain-containing protein n=1 Tax=Chrysophaeum taylorii TaxID=2483200 RepID=A0AAD7UP76_9STRA|nr:hypothetical protein CTAYLR_004908 [Chrysophaeum taylorii]
MTRHGYAEVFFKRGGLELLLRTMIVLPKLCDESNFASIMAKSLILNCVDAAMSHLDSGLALTSSTRGLESLLADAVHEYKKKSNWQKQAAIVLQMLSALCVRKRGTDVGVAPHQVVVWNVVDALIARERGGEESPNPRAAELIPAVVAPNDDASLACASEPPLSLALEPPRFYDFVAFLLPTVPLAVARLALTLLRNLADSADTTLDRRRARAEISYALTLVAATHGINNHPEEDIVSSTTTTCFRTCALLWQLRRRAEQVVRDKVALHPGTTTTAEEAEALQILGTIDGLEGDEARDAEQQLNNSAATGGSRASCLASLVRSEAAASGPIALALADGVASVFEETAPPSLRTNARWTSGVAALNGALARLAVLRKASQEDDEAVRWRIETSRGTDELVESEKRLAAAQREYEALTDLAQGARRVRDVLRTHSAAKALNNNAASKEMLKLEVEKLEGDVDGAELLAIALPVVEERRRLPTARREVEAAIRQQSAEVSRLTAEAARAEASVERWRRRRDAAPGRVAARVQAEKTWADANRDIHAICLRALRRCMPVDVSRRTAADVRAAAAARYGSEESPKLAYPLRLCERLVLRKLLHVAVARPEHLTTGDFLRYGDRLFEEYTVGELRAVYAAVSAAVPPSDRDIPGNAEEPESRVRRWRAALAKGLQHAEAMPGQQQQQQQQDKTRSSLTLAKTLARVEGLSQLSRPELERLCEAVVVETFPHDAYVIREGDVGDAFYVIARGTCACATRGTEVARLAANAYFGERALLRDEPRAASVRCVGAVTVFKITRRAFDEVRSSIQNTLQAEHERRARASEAFSKLDSDANAAAHLCHSAYSYPSQTEVEAMRARALRPQRVADEKRARVAALDAELERARLDRDVRTAAARAVKKADADARGRATAASSAYRRIASERNRAREEAAAADAATVDAAALAECDAIDSCARWGLPVAPPFDAELSANPDEVVGPPPAYRAPPAIERTVVSFREKQASLLASFGSKKQTPPPRGFEVAKLDVNALKVAKDLESIFRKSSPPTKKPPSSHVGRLNKGSAIVSALESVFGGPSKKEQQQQQQQQEQEPTTGFKEESDQQKKESQEAEDGPATSSSGREGERVRKKPRTSTEIRTELDDLLGRLEQVSRPRTALAETTNGSGVPGIFEALARGDPAEVRIAVRGHPASVNARLEGNTPLHVAVLLNSEAAVVEELVFGGASLNAWAGPARFRWQALHEAAARGNYEIVEVLLQSGANPAAVCFRTGEPLLAHEMAADRRVRDLILDHLQEPPQRISCTQGFIRNTPYV